MQSVLLFSGGLDSRVLLQKLLEDQQEVFCLSIDYGQRHRKELELAKSVTKKLRLKHEVVSLSGIHSLISGNALTGTAEVPDGHYQEESMKITVVPNRNMMMLSIAIGWAINLKAQAVSYAAHRGDHSIYPDCRPAFIAKMAELATLCDWHPVALYTPFSHFSKTMIVQEGARLNVDFFETWSCYKGLDVHCGTCGTCVERREAFAEAKITDPTIYLKRAA